MWRIWYISQVLREKRGIGVVEVILILVENLIKTYVRVLSVLGLVFICI